MLTIAAGRARGDRDSSPLSCTRVRRCISFAPPADSINPQMAFSEIDVIGSLWSDSTPAKKASRGAERRQICGHEQHTSRDCSVSVFSQCWCS